MLTPKMLLQLLVGLPLEMAEPGWKGTARFVYELDFIYNSMVHDICILVPHYMHRVLLVYTSGVLLGSLGGTLPNPHFS